MTQIKLTDEQVMLLKSAGACKATWYMEAYFVPYVFVQYRGSAQNEFELVPLEEFDAAHQPFSFLLP
jgi:hypothetical protein